MLNRVGQVVLRGIRHSTALAHVQPAGIKFSFSENNNLEERAANLKKLLQEEIQYEDSNKPDLSEQINYFQGANWTVNHNQTQVELSKQNGPYQVRILFNARTPMSEDEQPEQSEQGAEEQQPNEDYAEVAVFISKGPQKWLCAEFMVVNNECHMSVCNFIENYEQEKSERFKNKTSTASYQGPELSSLESGLMDNVTEFLESVGIDNTLLVQASDYSIGYEHKFYIEWLKNFESIC